MIPWYVALIAFVIGTGAGYLLFGLLSINHSDNE